MEKSQTYTRVPASESDSFSDDDVQQSRYHQQSSWLVGSSTVRGALTLLGMVTMLVLGFVLGANWQQITGRAPHRYAQTGTKHYYMKFNGTFAQKSNPASDAAWDSLFPKKLGFIKHPTLAPNVAGVAVFHELHCLNVLRQSYFAALDGTIQQTATEHTDNNHRTSKHHIRHCFEYLRQSLMCVADTNIEAFNYTIGGVSGWQSERTCKDYDGIKAWADQWGMTRHTAIDEFNKAHANTPE